ncbi:unnamed protein product [Linum tenue]|uniref:Cytochrome P450 n=1 Tax=Linum tenue TaxID=586396 RepID=A0AAV0KJT3_9ROSI|nr:unnamed protein product [Linum tenue]
MATAYYYYLLPTILFLLAIISKLNKRRRTDLPPSPPSLPIIGHLHLLKEPIHRTLQNLSQQYGPIYLLSLGFQNVVVVSSPSLAKECFHENDLVFANRPNLLSGRIFDYNNTTVGVSPYGPHWRNLRRISTVELLSTARLNSSAALRRDEVRLLARDLFRKVSGTSFGEVEMKSRLSALSMNVVTRMVVGKRYFESEEEDGGRRFLEVIRESFELSGASNPGDFLPVLRWIDYGGVEKRMRRVQGEVDSVLQGLIDERRSDRSSRRSSGQKTMMDTFLDLQESEPQTYTDDIIKGHVIVSTTTMISAGTDTSAVTMEWAMTLLLNHPKILNKARIELDDVVGKNRLIEEADCSKLPYLQSIINETLRLYPAAPLLVPHYSSEDCTIGGYHIPKGTMLLANAWAIQRDPSVWVDPTTFWPERHEGMEVDAYKLLPFGIGRRSCPGIGLANRVVSSVLGVLIQCFEWRRTSEELLDMTEGKGLTMPKVEPLVALYKTRECMKDVLLKV